MEVWVVIAKSQFLDNHRVELEAVFSSESLANEYLCRKLENDFDERSWQVFKGVVDKCVRNAEEATQ